MRPPAALRAAVAPVPVSELSPPVDRFGLFPPFALSPRSPSYPRRSRAPVRLCSGRLVSRSAPLPSSASRSHTPVRLRSGWSGPGAPPLGGFLPPNPACLCSLLPSPSSVTPWWARSLLLRVSVAGPLWLWRPLPLLFVPEHQCGYALAGSVPLCVSAAGQIWFPLPLPPASEHQCGYALVGPVPVCKSAVRRAPLASRLAPFLP